MSVTKSTKETIDSFAVSGTAKEVLNRLSREFESRFSGRRIQGLVQSLTFPASFDDAEVADFNRQLSDLYIQHKLCVLGGDTSRGAELVVMISAFAE